MFNLVLNYGYGVTELQNSKLNINLLVENNIKWKQMHTHIDHFRGQRTSAQYDQ